MTPHVTHSHEAYTLNDHDLCSSGSPPLSNSQQLKANTHGSHCPRAVIPARTPRWSRHSQYAPRLYGIALGMYAWSLWCCDHYQLDLFVSCGVIITGALVLWRMVPAPATSSSAASKQQLHRQRQNSSLMAVIAPDSILSSRTAPISKLLASTQSPSSRKTDIVLIQKERQSDNVIDAAANTISRRYSEASERSIATPMVERLQDGAAPFLPTDPPPPYDCRNRSTEGSTSTSNLASPSSPRNDDILKQQHWRQPQLQRPHQYHDSRYSGYIWFNFTVIVLGVCGWMVCLGICKSWNLDRRLILDFWVDLKWAPSWVGEFIGRFVNTRTWIWISTIFRTLTEHYAWSSASTLLVVLHGVLAITVLSLYLTVVHEVLSRLQDSRQAADENDYVGSASDLSTPYLAKNEGERVKEATFLECDIAQKDEEGQRNEGEQDNEDGGDQGLTVDQNLDEGHQEVNLIKAKGRLESCTRNYWNGHGLTEKEPLGSSSAEPPTMTVWCPSTKDDQTKNKKRVVTVRKRSLSAAASTSPTSPWIAVSICQVKREFKIWALTSLFVLTPTVVPRSVWGGVNFIDSERRGLSDRDQDEYEYDMVCHKETEHGDEDTLKGTHIGSRDSRHVLRRGLSEPWHSVDGALKRSPASESALSRLARIALDPERLQSIIQFYRRRHTAATESKDIIDSGGSDEPGQNDFAFVVRSSNLPMVRVGLYGTAQKRLWTSTGSMDLMRTEDEGQETSQDMSEEKLVEEQHD